MDTTSVSALEGVLGSLAGGAVMIGAALIGTRRLSRREPVRSEMRGRRESRWSRLTAVEVDV